MELFDYYYDAVDNDTLKAAYETIFNWTYIESAGPARDSSTTTYIFLGVSGSFILLIIVMDFTHLVSFAILPPCSVMGHGSHISISINAYAVCTGIPGKALPKLFESSSWTKQYH